MFTVPLYMSGNLPLAAHFKQLLCLPVHLDVRHAPIERPHLHLWPFFHATLSRLCEDTIALSPSVTDVKYVTKIYFTWMRFLLKMGVVL